LTGTVFWITLAIYLFVGIFVTRYIKTAVDYYVMGGKANQWLITGTLTATYMSASTMIGIAGIVYLNGPPIFMLVYGSWIGLVAAMLYSGRRLRAMGAMTMPDYLENRFGSRVRIAGTIAMIVGLFAYGLIQVMGAAILLADVIGLSYNQMVVIFGLALLVFVVLGGMWGVVTTDTIMLVTMIIATLVVAPLALVKAGGMEALTSTLPGIDPAFWSAGGAALNMPLGWTIGQWLLWAVFFIAAPWIVSRSFPARDDFALMKGTAISTILALVCVTIFFLGVSSVYVINPEIDPGDRVFVWTSLNLVHPFWGGLGLAGMMAGILSTASTIFIYAGFALSRDLFERITPKQYSDSQRILIARICQAIIGIGVIVVTLARPLAIYWIAAWSGGIFATSWAPVMILGFEWKRVTEKAALVGMLGGAAFYIILYALAEAGTVTLPFMLDPVIFGIVFTFVLMIVVSYMSKLSTTEIEMYEKQKAINLAEKTIREAPSWSYVVKEYKSTIFVAVLCSVIAIIVFGYLMIRIVPYV